MSVLLKHPTIDGNVVHVPGPQVKRWTAAGWIKVGKSDEAPTDPEQNAPRSTSPRPSSRSHPTPEHDPSMRRRTHMEEA